MICRLDTLAAPAELTQDIRKSRFRVCVEAVASPTEALAFIARVSDPRATHNCWAYRVGPSYRYCDDGEPGGTAGRPILQAIDGQGFDCVGVLVTRWYGGIKLGAGGLARAYGACAAECLRTAARISLVATVEVEFALPFAAIAVLNARLPEFEAEKREERFDGDGAEFVLALPPQRIEALGALLADLTRGRALLRRRNDPSR